MSSPTKSLGLPNSPTCLSLFQEFFGYVNKNSLPCQGSVVYKPVEIRVPMRFLPIVLYMKSASEADFSIPTNTPMRLEHAIWNPLESAQDITTSIVRCQDTLHMSSTMRATI